MKSTLVYPIHPRTGLSAIGLTAFGPIWPLLGSDGEEGDGGEDEEDDSEEESEGEDPEDEDSEKKSAKGKTVSQEEYDKLKSRMQAADKNRSAAEKRLAAIEKEGMDEHQRTKKELEEVTAERDGLKELNRKLALGNAFNMASATAKIRWADAGVAFAAGKFGELEIDEEGEVVGMLEAVKKLAKDKKFLVSADNEEEEELSESGSKVGSRRKVKDGGKKKLSAEELRKRFPALR